MATVVTRSLFGKNADRSDCVAVKVNKKDYEGKWGVQELVVTSYNWGAASQAKDIGWLDIRQPNFNPRNHTAIADKVWMDNVYGNVTVNKKLYFAVNNGEFGPETFEQGDGTVDLLHLCTEVIENTWIEGHPVTLTYTLSAFTDLTPSSMPSETSTLTLNVGQFNDEETAYITDAASTFTSKSGRVAVTLRSLVTTGIDRPKWSKALKSIQAAGNVYDSVPLFTAPCVFTPGSFGAPKVIERVWPQKLYGNLAHHPVTKFSGTKTYDYRDQFFVFAVNDGKVDGNATLLESDTSRVAFVAPTLKKLPEWPCDDDVTVVVSYNRTFTQMDP